MTMNAPRRCIRLFQDDDEMAVVRVWHRSGRAAYTYLPTWQALTIERARTVFHEVIRPRCTIWVGLRDEHIVAYMAMKESCIDRLYVDPTEWRMGWGTQLLSLAKTISPHGLELYTHQANHAARSLYEKHGFRAVAFGTSPPPECTPDVSYQWRP